LTRHQTLGYDLYQKLLGSVAHSFEKKSRLIIVPDGALYYLPFETLITQEVLKNEEANYLIKDFEISTGPSSSVLCHLKEKRHRTGKRNETLIAFGDPYFGDGGEDALARGEAHADSAAMDPESSGKAMTVRGLYEQRGFQFKRLPFSGSEVMEIGKLFSSGDKTLYIGEKAKEEVVKQTSLQSYTYVHFATHGIIDQKAPARSGIVLTLGEDSDEDGFLQVNEIFNLDLDADLVVLSACNTGLGKLRRGEGIVGLTRAFMYAGTPSVLVSLWNINDRSTADFMKIFYEQLMKGNSKARALQLAKLAMLGAARRSYQHPFYWAPFVLVGDHN
jgi:CHAT domain-containing protein